MVVGEGGRSSGVLLYHQKMKLVLDRFCFYKFYFFYMIMDRCIYLNQDHFVTQKSNLLFN